MLSISQVPKPHQATWMAKITVNPDGKVEARPRRVEPPTRFPRSRSLGTATTGSRSRSRTAVRPSSARRT